MDQQTYAAVMDRLEAFVQKVGTDCRREWLENGIEELRFLSALQQDGTDLALFRLAVVRLEGMDLAQVCVTVLAQVGQGREALARAVAQWNPQSQLGSYAIEGDQLTHRTRLSLNSQVPAEETAEQIIAAVTLVYEELSRRSRAAHTLAAGTARD